MAEVTVRLGLLTPYHVTEAWEELASRNVPAADFLRVMERKEYLTSFQTGKLLKGDKDGFFLGGYRILYKIASGSFGRVFRANDPATGRGLAIKVLRKKWSEDKHKIDLFMREGKMGMSLRHPNIVEIVTVNHEQQTNQYYIVMEFVEGGNLRDLLNIRKKLQPTEVLRIVEDIASALVHASSKGLTHRDIKLTNILLSAQGPAKLVDFGLAGGQIGGGGGGDDEEVTVDRTVDYAGLERVTGAPSGDIRSDIFFVGCVAYELLTGRPPLEMGRSAQMRMSAQRFNKIEPLKPSDMTAPASVFRLTENMLALDPEARIQTPSQLLDRVRECRRELEPNAQGAEQGEKKAQTTIFLVESDETLQDLLRQRLKDQGYRMLIAADPARALERFRQQSFDLLIVNASTTGENGFFVFETVMEEARRRQIDCRGILLLDEAQANWQERIPEGAKAVTLIQPVKYKQLLHTIQTLEA